MQINGRLQFDIKIDDKDYKLSGNLIMKENINIDIDHEAETIANRIMSKVREKSSNKTIPIQQTAKYSQTEHIKSLEQNNSRQETLKNDYKTSDYRNEFRSSCNLVDEKINIYELTTPQKKKLRNTKSQTSIRKELSSTKKSSTIQLAESQYIIENPQFSSTKDGKQIIKLIDNAHNLIKKNTSILNKVQIQSPLKSIHNNTKSSSNLKTQQSSNKKKEDIVTQLLGSLRNAKKIKDEYQKRFF